VNVEVTCDSAALERPSPPGCQVWVKGFGSVEPTLFWYTALALEDLGGAMSGMGSPRVRRYYDDRRRQYGGPVTEADLLRRVRAADRSEVWKTCLALPILLPVSALIWAVVGMLLLRDLLREFVRPWRQRGGA
jgi:hypothetical protein